MSASSATMQRNLSEDYIPFLDYPHSHDPTCVSDIAALSIDMLRQLPKEVQDSLWQLQESTSIVYASYARFQDLLAEKFDRLSLTPGSDSCKPCCRPYTRVKTSLTLCLDSEETFFNYINQCTAERTYLFHDALPEWKHKLRDVRLDEYLRLTFRSKSKETTVRDWFTNLQDKVTEWAQQARSAEVPDFDDTVLEYTSASTTPTTLASTSSTSLADEISRPPSMSQPTNGNTK